MRLQTLHEARLHKTHPFVDQLQKLIAKYHSSDEHFVEQYYEIPPVEAGEIITSLFGRYAGTFNAAHGTKMVKWKPRGTGFSIILDPSEDAPEGVWIVIEDANLK